MRKSSANQLPLDWGPTTSLTSTGGSGGVLSQQLTPEESAPSGTIDFGRFDAYDRTYAETARLAGRLNAASIPHEEHEALFRERQALLDKKFAGTLTRQEANKLEYVRWSLDRIEDAKHGHALDFLEGRVSAYEQFLDDVRGLEADLRRAAKRKR